MAKKKTKYLELYYEWMEKGEVIETPHTYTYGGLCSTELFNSKDFWDLFKPEDTERVGVHQHAYWAAGVRFKTAKNRKCTHGFTPLRQTIVLFLAAMNGEL